MKRNIYIICLYLSWFIAFVLIVYLRILGTNFEVFMKYAALNWIIYGIINYRETFVLRKYLQKKIGSWEILTKEIIKKYGNCKIPSEINRNRYFWYARSKYNFNDKEIIQMQQKVRQGGYFMIFLFGSLFFSALIFVR